MFAPLLQRHAAKSPTLLRAVSWALCGLCFWALIFKNVGFSVVGNPALSITGNLYAGAFVPGAFVGHLDKNRCGAFFVVCH
jgi:hypothetical protein